MASIKVGPNEPVEKAIKRFKRLVDKESIVRECKRREFYENPSTIRNRNKKALQRKVAKRLRRVQAGKNY